MDKCSALNRRVLRFVPMAAWPGYCAASLANASRNYRMRGQPSKRAYLKAPLKAKSFAGWAILLRYRSRPRPPGRERSDGNGVRRQAFFQVEIPGFDNWTLSELLSAMYERHVESPRLTAKRKRVAAADSSAFDPSSYPMVSHGTVMPPSTVSAWPTT